MKDKRESVWDLLKPSWPSRCLNLLVLGKLGEMAEEVWTCPRRKKDKVSVYGLQEDFS